MSNPGPNSASSISTPMRDLCPPAGATAGNSATDLVGMHGSACVQAATIALITTAATGTEIAVAVNALITALINKGVIAAAS